MSAISPTDKRASAGRTNGEAAGESEDAQIKAQIEEQLEALSIVFERHYRDLYKQALAIVRSPDLADDVVQEAVVFTAQTIKKGTLIRTFKPWLRAVVRNSARSVLARRRVRLAAAAPLEEGMEIAAPQQTGELLDARDRLDEVNRIVKTLPSAQQSAFLLAELRGLDYPEIARALDRSEGAVRQLLCRARGRVREIAENGHDLAQIGLPVNVGVAQCAGWQHRGGGLRHSVLARIADLQQSVNSFVHQSIELATHPSAALVAGAMIAGSLPAVDGGTPAASVSRPALAVAVAAPAPAAAPAAAPTARPNDPPRAGPERERQEATPASVAIVPGPTAPGNTQPLVQPELPGRRLDSDGFKEIEPNAARVASAPAQKNEAIPPVGGPVEPGPSPPVDDQPHFMVEARVPSPNPPPSGGGSGQSCSRASMDDASCHDGSSTGGSTPGGGDADAAPGHGSGDGAPGGGSSGGKGCSGTGTSARAHAGSPPPGGGSTTRIVLPRDRSKAGC